MKEFFIIVIFLLCNNAFAEDRFHLENNVDSYLKDYNYDEENEALLSRLICDCMNRFEALENLIEMQDFAATSSEGIIIASYSLGYLTMDVYSFSRRANSTEKVKYFGKSSSYGIEGVQKIHVDYQLVSSAISNFFNNERIAINQLRDVTDTGCYFIHAYRNGKSENWLVPFEILPDPGVLQGTFFEPAEEIIISAQ